jgi:hypothetical protein
MKDDTRKAFEAAIAKVHARDAEVQTVQEKHFSERQRFETDYRRAVVSVILPALQEVALDVLEPAGWTCHVRSTELDQVTLEVYRGDMKSVSGSQRPNLSFSQDRLAPKMNVYAGTQSQGGSEASYALEAITPDLIHEHALKFFESLADGR